MTVKENSTEEKGRKWRLPISSDLLNVLLGLLFYRVAYLCFMRLTTVLLPSLYQFQQLQIDNTYKLPPHPGAFVLQLIPWDAAIYLNIAKNGYPLHTGQLAMYPLWPFLIHIFAKITSLDYVAAGEILVNIISIASFAVLYEYVKAKFNAQIAQRTMLLMLAFPSALFFAIPYTEALFLLLVGVTFLQMHRKNWLAAGIAAFLSVLCRPTGVFLAVPLLIAIVQQKELRKLAFVLFPAAGMAAYFMIMYFVAGDPFAGFKAQQLYPEQASLADLLHPQAFIDAFITAPDPHNVHLPLSSPFDRFWFVVTVILLFKLYRGDKTLFAYAALVTVIPAITVKFMSFSRFVEMAFPLFILVSAQSLKSKYDWWYNGTVGILYGVQVLFLLRQMNYWWAG